MTPDTAVLTIDRAALAKNYRALCAAAQKNTETAAVIKCNAYGLGLAELALVLAAENCKSFFVAQFTEGVALRQLLPDVTIYILNGLTAPPQDYTAHNLIPCLINRDQMTQWQNYYKATESAAAALFIDTGFHRLGLSAEEVLELADNPALFEGWSLALIASHLACADTPDHPQNRAQLETFNTARAMLPNAPASLANSGGIALGKEFHFDLTRPGIALYGGAPTGNPHDALATVATLEAPILQLRQLSVGDSIGYGADFTAAREMSVAIIGVGYGDGLPRQMGLRPPGMVRLSVGGYPAPIVGRVSMDSLAIDISDLPEKPSCGTMVQIFGPDNPIDQLAAQLGTLSYELLTGLGNRYKRVYI